MGFDFQQLARDLFTRKLLLDRTGEELILLRFIVALYDIEKFFQTESEAERLSLVTRLEDLVDTTSEIAEKYCHYFDFLRETIAYLHFLGSQQLSDQRPWRGEIVTPEALKIPGMVTRDTMKYYGWLGTTLTGAGHAVEIGCWMGRSTYSLATGLAANRAFAGRFLYALDAFVWNKWLDDYADNYLHDFDDQARVDLQELRIGDNYMHLFLKFCKPFKDLLKPRSCFLYVNGKTGDIPPLEWNGEPVELLIQDVSGDLPTTQKTWDIFSASFIPNKTVVIFQQHGHLRADGIRRFVREHADCLAPLHKPYGVAKAFRFTGGE